jgi:mycothiol synthase
MADLDEVMEVLDASAIAMRGRPDNTRSGVQADWGQPSFSLKDDSRVVETADGRLVGYIEVWERGQPPVNVRAFMRVHPEVEGTSLGRLLLDWAEERAGRTAQRVPDGLRVALQASAYRQYEPSRQRLLEFGMAEVRYFWIMGMELDARPAEPQWPDGIALRTMQGEADLEPIVRTVRDAFSDHWGQVPRSMEAEMEFWRHAIAVETFDPSLWWMALDGDEVAGVSLCRASNNGDETCGWVGTLGVRRPWRKRGLGMALLLHALGELHSRGKAGVGLAVDGDSLTGATRLYERAGMSVVEQEDLFQKIVRPGRDITVQDAEAAQTPPQRPELAAGEIRDERAT